MPINGIALLAHRGARLTSPENTMEAFRKARLEGADAVECDVRLTADGEPVLFHDRNALRAAGRLERIDQLRWKEARELEVFGGRRIPHAAEVLEFMADWPSGQVYFDLHENSLRLVEVLAKMIAGSGLFERCYILDFYSSRHLLIHAQEVDSRVRLSVMPGPPWYIARSLREINARSLCIGWDRPLTYFLYKSACLFYDVRSEIDRAQARGAQVSGGVANSAAEILYFLKQGVTGIWTDDLIMAREALAKG